MSNNRELGYVVGAVAGYFTGGLSYVALGATAGGIIGGLLDPKTQTQGPRLDDLKVQFSSYGVGVPVLYGTQRIAPNVIWSTDKIETSLTQSQGKGGGGVENTSYRYYVQMRLLLCEKPRDGSEVSIVQLFQDGKLIYDARSGIPLASALASAENPYAFFTLYQGKPDQLPDPVEEIYEDGPGSVPAYRGVVSISMKGIECPGGRVPQFSFVLTSGGTIGNEITAYVEDELFLTAFVEKDGIWGSKTHFGDGTNAFIQVSYSNGGALIPQGIISIGVIYSGTDLAYAINGASEPFVMMPYRKGFFDLQELRVINLKTGTNTKILETPNDYLTPGGMPIGSGYRPRGAVDREAARYAATSGVFGGPAGLTIIAHGDFIEADATGMSSTSPIVFHESDLYVLTIDGATPAVRRIDAETGLQLNVFEGPSTGSPDIDGCAIHSNDEGLFVYLYELGASAVYRIVEGVWVLQASGVVYAGAQSAANTPTASTSNWICNSLYAYIGPNVDGQWSFVRFNAVNLANALVSEIIADQCQRSAEMRYDVSEIPDEDTVIGYVIANPGSARANIDPLLTAFQIFIVDEDGLIKFKKYVDIASVADIGFDELGQAEDGSEPGDPMPLTRTQEIDLPRSVSICYIEPTNDYQTATEKVIRQVTNATEDMLVQLPMAVSSDQARKASTNILYSLWRRQNTRTCKVSRKFAFMSPGDGGMYEYPRDTRKLWRVVAQTDTGAVIEQTLEPGDAELYEQVAPGETGYVGQQVSPLSPPTLMLPLDIPILRDSDNNPGLYMALTGLGTAWRGAQLNAGDSASDLQIVGTVSNSATRGNATGLLSDWQSNVVDETNVLSLRLTSGELYSTTRDLMLTSNVNACAVGADGRWEILQFQRAQDLGGGEYELTGLLRTRLGTEHAAALHQVGDIFVLLQLAGILRPTMDLGDLGLARVYEAVSVGRRTGSQILATNAGVGLKPYAPVDLRAERDISGDILFSWKRRTRLSERWLQGVVPLGEATEAYEVDVVDGSTIVRTISVTTPEATYTVDQQYEDFGTLPEELGIAVAQMSASVGGGYEAVGSFDIPPGDATSGGGVFPGSSSVVGPVILANAGGTLIAGAAGKYSGNWRWKFFESSDGGQSFTDVGMVPLGIGQSQALYQGEGPSAFYVFIALAEDGTPSLWRGVPGSLPSQISYPFGSGFGSVAWLGTDGALVYALGQGNVVWSTSDGITWTNTGTTSGLPAMLGGGSGELNLVNGYWYARMVDGTYRTSDPALLTGWAACITPDSRYFSRPLYNGVTWAAIGRSNALLNTLILESADGLTWTSNGDPAVLEYVNSYSLGGEFFFTQLSQSVRYTTSGGTVWNTGSLGFSPSNISLVTAIAGGRASLIGYRTGPTDPGALTQQVRSSPDGLTFTPATGIDP